MTTWTKEMIKEMLATKDAAVERALVVLLERQTADEQSAEMTNHANGIGFSSSDAAIMTSMAKQVIKRRAPGKLVLSPKQLAYLRSGKSDRYPSRIGKYAGQLARIANEKAEKEASAS